MAKFNNDILFQSIEVLKPSKTHLEALHRLQIRQIKDLLFHTPNYYIHKNVFPTTTELRAGTHIIAKIYIEQIEDNFRTRKPLKVRAKILSNDVPITLIFFRKPPVFIKKLLQVGRELIVEGKLEFFSHQYQISHPEFILNDKSFHAVQPIYPLTYGITQKQIYRYVLNALAMGYNSMMHNFDAMFPMKFSECLNAIHHKTITNISPEKALYFASLFELTANQLAFHITKNKQKQIQGRQFTANPELQEQALNTLGFTLAEGQASVLQEIEQDQKSEYKMIRMLQGDVGSGKTLVALLSMLNAVSNNAQTVLMAPTDLLANQHYNFFSKALDGTEIHTALLTGATKTKERRELLADLQTGKINILIGTHALFQQGVEFADLGYIVIDEQHRFGVGQRLELVNKSNDADLLVMTATPIPRTLALSLYGDMDVSRMNGKLRMRPPITTSVIAKNSIEHVEQSLSKITDKNEQVYWVCPLIENLGDEETESGITSVTERFNALEERYPGQVALLHGKLAAKTKNNIMQQFSSGEKKILVSTTVIEVGIDVAAASLIVIEHAEKFGLAQLHQLRGRVGRSDRDSFCILLYDNKRTSQIARKRLEVMKNSADGFEIAEQDLVLRGTGEMLGTKQSGDQNFIFNSIDAMQSFDLIKEAQKNAIDIHAKMNIDEQQFLLQLFNKGLHNIESG